MTEESHPRVMSSLVASLRRVQALCFYMDYVEILPSGKGMGVHTSEESFQSLYCHLHVHCSRWIPYELLEEVGSDR